VTASARCRQPALPLHPGAYPCDARPMPTTHRFRRWASASLARRAASIAGVESGMPRIAEALSEREEGRTPTYTPHLHVLPIRLPRVRRRDGADSSAAAATSVPTDLQSARSFPYVLHVVSAVASELRQSSTGVPLHPPLCHAKCDNAVTTVHSAATLATSGL
jgi:hypothetical protein